MADEQFNIRDFLENLGRRAVKGGVTAEVNVGKDGKVSFRDTITGTVTSKLSEIRQRAESSGTTGLFDFSKGLKSPHSQQGKMHRGFLEMVQTQLGSDYKVTLETRSVDKASIYDFKTNWAKRGGLLMPGDDSSSVLRITGKDGVLSHGETLDKLNELGFFVDPTGKGLKRIRGLMNPQAYSMGGARSQVYAFDVGNIEHSKIAGIFSGSVAKAGKSKLETQIAKHAFDGSYSISQKMGYQFAEVLKARAATMAGLDSSMSIDDLITQVSGSSPKTGAKADVLNKALRHLEDAKKVENSATKRFGIFNMRDYGFTVEDLKEVNKFLPEGERLPADLMLKGNVTFMGGKIEKALGKALGYVPDVLTEIQNLKTEGGLRSTGKAGGFKTLSPHHGARMKNVYLDIDTMLTHSDFFDFDEVLKYNSGIFEDMIKSLESGFLPEPLEEALANFKPAVLPKDVSASLMDQESDAFFSNLKHMLENKISISDDPTTVRQVLNAYIKGTYKKGAPKMAIPDAYRAEVQSMSQVNLGEHGKRLQKGMLDLVGEDIVTMSDENAYMLKEAFGGNDFDDALNMLLRWDDTRDRLVAITYRQPTGIGEHAVLDVDPNAELVDQILKRSSNPEARSLYAERLQAKKEMKELNLRQAKLVSERRSLIKQRDNNSILNELNKRSSENVTLSKREKQLKTMLAQDARLTELDQTERVATEPFGPSYKPIDRASVESELSQITARRSTIKREIAGLRSSKEGKQAARIGRRLRKVETNLSGIRERLAVAPSVLRENYMNENLPRLIAHHENSDKLLATSVALNEATRGLFDQETLARIARHSDMEIDQLGAPRLFEFVETVEEVYGDSKKSAAVASGKLTAAKAMSQQELLEAARADLGIYTNARMVVGSVFQQHPNLLEDLSDAAEAGKISTIKIIKSEKIIDASINAEGGGGAHTVKNAAEDMLFRLGEILGNAQLSGETDVKVSAALINLKGGRQKIMEGAKSVGLEDPTQVFSDQQIFDRIFTSWGIRVDEMSEKVKQATKRAQGKSVLNEVAFTGEQMDQADEFLDTVERRLTYAKQMGDVSESVGDSMLDDAFDSFGLTTKQALLMDEAHRDILEEVGKWVDPNAPDVDDFFGRFGAVLKRSDERGGLASKALSKSLFGVSGKEKLGLDMAYLSSATRSYYKEKAVQSGRVVLSPTQKYRYKSEQRMLSSARSRIGRNEIAESAKLRPMPPTPGGRRANRFAQAASESKIVNEARKRMPSMFDPALAKSLWSNTSVRSGGIGLLALVGASFLYQGMKGRSSDEMNGPPMLPGGSAYEKMPSPDFGYMGAEGYAGMANSGTNYQVRIKSGGSQQVAEGLFGLTNASINATMYPRIGNLTEDYDSIAGSY